MTGGRRLSFNWIGVVPFLAYVGVFLLLPTGVIIAGAFLAGDGSATLSNFKDLSRSYVISATVSSIFLSALTAIVGAFFGALLAYAIAAGNPQGVLRRVVVSAAGVLAQFGGVTLAFAFLASIGPAGIVYVLAKQHGFDIHELFGKRGKGKGSVAPKYRDPNNAENTWTGRGRPPRWLAAATCS